MIKKNVILQVCQGRDNGNDFLFPVPSLFLKLNDNDLKSLLNGYPICFHALRQVCNFVPRCKNLYRMFSSISVNK